jgi:hypothetical protein
MKPVPGSHRALCVRGLGTVWVYLAGALTSKGTNPPFAVLPSAARPGHVLYLTVCTHGAL